MTTVGDNSKDNDNVHDIDAEPSQDFERVMRELASDEEEEEEEVEVEEVEVEVEVEEPQKSDLLDEDVEFDDEDDEEELQKPYGPVILPMPDLSNFSVALPGEEADSAPASVHPPPPEPAPLAPLPAILHVPALLKPYETDDPSPSLQGLQVCHMGRESGLRGEMQAMYLRLPPGTRMSRPVAHRLGDIIVYCISGIGLVWQNGWTFAFNPTDSVGWKAGTGTPHTVINDSNADGTPGEDLVLLVAHEVKPEESYYYPYSRDEQFAAAASSSDGKTKISIWSNPPVQSDIGPHPGVPSMSASEIGNAGPPPSSQVGYRPSNLINTITELDGIGEGELFANATSLSQETGLSGRFGCNFEVPPPGARSSEPHAHSLEDELVYVVSGDGVVWLNGTVSPVSEGDVVGFPAGTGIAHTFINDSNAAEGEEGNPLMLWILGQNRVREGDLVHYPLKVEEAANVNSKRWWPDPPKYELGPHDGHAKRPLRA